MNTTFKSGMSENGDVRSLKNDVIIGVDVGTTETKAILINKDGKILSESSRELQSIYVREGWIEQNLESIWMETAKVIRDCTRNIDLRRLICLSITGQRETICPLDEKFEPLGNAISWQDTRGWEICKRMRQQFGMEEAYRITGLPINAMPSASKIAWIKENKPAIYEKTWKFVGVVDYIVWKLSDILRIDYTNACRTLLFDISRLKWSDKIFQYLKLDINKMPELIPIAQPVGTVTKKASEKIYIPHGITIVYGGGDQQCSALGVGITAPNRISCVLGSCTNIEACSEKLPLDPNMRLQAQIHVIPNSYLAEGGIGSSGSIYRWFRDNFAEDVTLTAKRVGKNPYSILDAEVEKVPPGSLGLIMIPYFTGSLYPYWNADDRGMFIGLRLNHGKRQFARSILEGIAYEYGRMAKDIQHILGIKANQIRFMGGGANSKIWPKIIVDVLGVEGSITRNIQAGAMGAAILGSLASGWFKDAKSAVESLIKVDRKLKVNQSYHEKYKKYFNIYEKIYDRIQDLVNELSHIEAA